MSNFVKHCEAELRMAGLFDKDSDYTGMIGKAVMRLAKVHAKEVHSGFSSSMVREIFYKLLNWETLTPITSNPAEWMRISRKEKVWQSRRSSCLFSTDGGKTYYSINDKKRGPQISEPPRKVSAKHG